MKEETRIYDAWTPNARGSAFDVRYMEQAGFRALSFLIFPLLPVFVAFILPMLAGSSALPASLIAGGILLSLLAERRKAQGYNSIIH